MAKPDERKVARARRILGQQNAEKPTGEDSRSDPRRQSLEPQTENDDGETAKAEMEENNQTETGEHRETEGQRDKEIPGSDGKKIRSDDRQVVEQRDEVSCRRSVSGM